jgi:hypothetical protein
MTDHPLTDEIIEKIAANIRHYDYSVPIIFKCDMRAAADWQLEQVIKWIKSELGRDCYLDHYGHEVDVEYVLEDLEEAMRPQQQENN